MIHQQIMNFPFQDHLAYMSEPEPEPEAAIMFPATSFPAATTDFPSSFSTPPLMTSLFGHDDNKETVSGGSGYSSPMEAMREMMFRVAAMQPVRIDPDSVKPRKRKNVRISNDPQSVAARHRRERISERIRILQRLVPGGTKMDTASMLEEAVRYLKFLKREVKSLEEMAGSGRQAGPWRGSGFGPGGPADNCVGRSSWGLRGPYSMMHSNVVGEGM